MNSKVKTLEKQFYSDGYRLGMKLAESNITDDALYKAVGTLHHMVDEIIKAFTGFAGENNKMPACSKGCHWCCHQPVFALSYELDLLNNFLQNKFNEEIRNHIAIRADDKRRKLSACKDDEILHSKIPCPLLEDGICIAYEARPVACRIYLSTDVDSCLKFFHDPENDESIPALLQFPMRMGRLINEGFKAALKANGVKVEEFRIEEKL
jgi:Fe-S-cluster containining protein